MDEDDDKIRAEKRMADLEAKRAGAGRLRSPSGASKNGAAVTGDWDTGSRVWKMLQLRGFNRGPWRTDRVAVAPTWPPGRGFANARARARRKTSNRLPTAV